MSEFLRIFRDIGLTFVSSIISMLIGLVLTILLGRYLGADDLGLYRIASTIYGLSMLVLSFGIPAAMVKYTAEYKDCQKSIDSIVSAGIISSGLLGIACTTLLLMSAVPIASLFHNADLSNLLIILSPIFPFSFVGNALISFSNGMRTMKTYAKATILQSVIMIIVSSVLIYRGHGVAGAIVGMEISAVANCLYLFYVTKGSYKLKLANVKQTMKGLLAMGIDILMANGINQINYQADIILIGYILSATDVAYYSVAVLLSTFIWIIPQGIQTITYPAITEYWKKGDRESIQFIVNRSLKYSACLLVPLSLAVIFFSAAVVRQLYGPQFLQAIPPLQILIIGTVINGSMQRPIGSILYSLDKPKLNLKIFTLAAAGNISLNVLLIPVLGIVGASVATVFSYLLITFSILYYTIKMAGVSVDFRWFGKMGLLFFAVLLAYGLVGHIHYMFTGGLLVALSVAITWVHFLPPEDKKYAILYFKRRYLRLEPALA